MPFTVLVVDDFAPIRRLVCSMLDASLDFRVVGQAADGLEGVRQAEALQADVVLLDITLPGLNGIAAARRIREVAPKSRVVFLSQNAAPEIVAEALSTGACGYVIKLDAGNELLEALASAVEGRRFVSGRLSGSRAPEPDPTIARFHEVRFAPHEGLLESFADFVAAALAAGKTAIFVASEPEHRSLAAKLQHRGVDFDSAVEQGRYMPQDVDHVLSGFMAGDLPDPSRFALRIRDLHARAVRAATGSPPRVVACGWIAPVLLARGNAEAAIRVEQLWDDMAVAAGVETLCGYPAMDTRGENERDIFQRICAVHTAVRA
jgi:DNA-binding NarL/FixJ family response regulator